MGRIRKLADDQECRLATETLVGRSRSADLRLGEDFVSAQHASLAWSGSGWEVRDLGSRNGTQVNGKPIEPGTAQTLRVGDDVCFGDATARWRLVEPGPPTPFAVGPEGETVDGRDGMLSLPSADAPEAMAVLRPNGAWQFEYEGDVEDVEDRRTVVIGGRPWMLRLPMVLDATHGATLRLSLSDLSLRGSLEDASLCVHVTYGSERFSFELGASGPLFLHLVRAQHNGAEGWEERTRLLDTLGVTANSFNVTVFRIRRQFERAGFADAAQIIERGRGRIRLGTRVFRVEDSGGERT